MHEENLESYTWEMMSIKTFLIPDSKYKKASSMFLLTYVCLVLPAHEQYTGISSMQTNTLEMEKRL